MVRRFRGDSRAGRPAPPFSGDVREVRIELARRNELTVLANDRGHRVRARRRCTRRRPVRPGLGSRLPPTHAGHRLKRPQKGIHRHQIQATVGNDARRSRTPWGRVCLLSTYPHRANRVRSAAVMPAPGFASFLDREGVDQRADGGVGPPPADQIVQQQPDQQHTGETGAQRRLPGIRDHACRDRLTEVVGDRGRDQLPHPPSQHRVAPRTCRHMNAGSAPAHRRISVATPADGSSSQCSPGSTASTTCSSSPNAWAR